MNYSGIKMTDIADGEGVRCALFVSGCRNHCKGCFNPQTWDFNHGDPFTYETMDRILDRLSKPYISGITILGGDPFEPQNIRIVTNILYLCKRMYPEKSTWVYTGYQYEDFSDNDIMRYIDVLVDGPFVLEQRDISLKFRGSRNQRIIDVPISQKKGEAVISEIHSCKKTPAT